MVSLYHNEGNGLFVDEARNRKWAEPRGTLGFGCFFFDYDNDGWQDIFVADGHIEDQIDGTKRVSYAETFASLPQSRGRQVSGSHGTDGASFSAPNGAARLS